MRAIRWISFFVLCWGLAFMLANTKGCMGAGGADLLKKTVTHTPDGKTVTEEQKGKFRFPAKMDTLAGFKFSLDSIEVGGMTSAKIKVTGWLFPLIGIALLLIGGLLAFGAMPYVSTMIGGPQPVGGGIVAAVGGFCIVWPSIEEGVSVILIVCLALSAAVGLALVWGRFFQAAKTKERATKAKAKLDAEGKPDEGTAALRVGDVALDKAMAAASAARATTP
jgi:hypothetical protein